MKVAVTLWRNRKLISADSVLVYFLQLVPVICTYLRADLGVLTGRPNWYCGTSLCINDWSSYCFITVIDRVGSGQGSNMLTRFHLCCIGPPKMVFVKKIYRGAKNFFGRVGQLPPDSWWLLVYFKNLDWLIDWLLDWLIGWLSGETAAWLFCDDVGGLGVLLSVVCPFTVYETPHEHPYMVPGELDYIQWSMGDDDPSESVSASTAIVGQGPNLQNILRLNCVL